MNAKVEAEGSRLDSVKLLVALLLETGGIVGYYYFDDQLPWVRVLGLLVVTAIALFVLAQTALGRGVIGFITGARSEIQRVVWPTRTETIQTTLAVLFLVLLLGIALWLLDMVLLWAIQLLTGQGG